MTKALAIDLHDPSLLPLRLDGARVDLVRLDEAEYRAASFLDERLLAGGRPVETRAWREVAAGAPAPRRTHFVFHIGHCGSTLLARLLGEHPALFVLREPAPLRPLGAGGDLSDLRPLLGLYGRVWREDQTALIKATSFVAAIAPELMATTGGAAILLSSAPGVYLRTILAAEGSRGEAAALASFRADALAKRLGVPVAATRGGEVVAMGWLCGVMALEAAARPAPERTLWIDFDRLLASPAIELAHALAHLGADPAGIDLKALVEGPILKRYSKAPEHAYDAGLRRALLDQAERQGGEEVRAGMAWLQAMADAHPAAVRPALARAAGAARGSPSPA